MSISAEGQKHIYDGNDSDTVFTFTFDALSASHVIAFLTDADGADTLITDNFTVDLTAKTYTYPNSGSAIATGTKITVLRDTPNTQIVNLKQQRAYDAEAHEDALDKLTMQIQDLQEQLNRCFKVGISETTSPTTASAFIAAINASYPIFSAGTFDEVTALAVAEPTVRRFAWVTDDQQFGIYVADTNVGDDGWIWLGGG